MSEQTTQVQAGPSGGLRQFIEENPRRANMIGAVILVAVTLLAYARTFQSGFVWDDNYYVTENPLLKNWDGLRRIWVDVIPDPSTYALPQYYPMTHTSFWLEYHLWGLNPTGYHAVNLTLHICNAMLIWLLLRKLSVPGAWLAAILFAVHPINVESVAWVAERKNVLCLLFYLSSLYVYLRYAGVIRGREKVALTAPADSKSPQIEWFTLPDDPQRLYMLAVVLFLCALFSKTIASSMPAAALLIIWWKRGGKLTRDDILPALPLLVVGAAMGMLTAYMERVRVGIAERPEDWQYAPTMLGQLAARCIIAGRVIWFYVAKILLPYPLSFNYTRWTIDPSSPVQYLGAVAVIVVVALLVLYRKKLGNGPLVAVLFFNGTLFPALGFMNVWPMRYSFVADHFVYISMIGLIALVAALLVRYLSLEALTGVAVAAVVLYFGLTYSHAQIFQNPRTLWFETWKQSGRTSWMAANNYGELLREHGRPEDLDGAQLWFEEVLKLKPNHPEARLNLARIAAERARMGERYIAWLATTRPTTQQATPATTAPTTQQITDSYEQAILWYKDAYTVQPNFTLPRVELGKLLISLGREDEAMEQFRKTVEIHPRDSDAHFHLGMLLLKRDKTKQAVDHLISAVELEPDSLVAHENLGLALLQQGRLEDGLAQWAEVMRLDPTNPYWPNKFGARMLLAGEYGKAIEYLQRALQLDPMNVPAITNYGIAAVKSGFPAEGQKLFERALTLDPKFEPAKENLEALKSGRLRPATRPAGTQPTTSPH
ncbi:MAG TPA: tetratricopeptide repeat protein [Tepidisphaeraceae bacterium]|jgi:tetratricopeptide (TPR) repeat protein